MTADMSPCTIHKNMFNIGKPRPAECHFSHQQNISQNERNSTCGWFWYKVVPYY